MYPHTSCITHAISEICISGKGTQSRAAEIPSSSVLQRSKGTQTEENQKQEVRKIQQNCSVLFTMQVLNVTLFLCHYWCSLYKLSKPVFVCTSVKFSNHNIRHSCIYMHLYMYIFTRFIIFSFHRHLRKEKMKQEKKNLDNLAKSDPVAYQETLQKIEKEHAMERMSLKHRGGSKYMQKQIIYGKYDMEV